MGRRPNQLVLEFFDRGRKLEDNSNRYEHTCKRCSEVFPKGRIDSLMGHLLRRCPGVTQEDRKLVFHHMQQTPEKTGASKATTKRNSIPSGEPRQIAMSQPENPLVMFQQQSALDTLAEVSRRHLDFRQNAAGHEFTVPDDERNMATQIFMSQLQQAAESAVVTTSAESEGIHFFNADTSLVEQKLDAAALASSALAASPLVQTAPIIPPHDEPLPPLKSSHQAHNANLDPQLSTVGPQAATELQSQPVQMYADEEAVTWNPTSFSGNQTFGDLTAPSTDLTPGFGLLQKPTRSKVRSRFSDGRRKEVQGIRKRGACIRCRMLKKPCSDGDPCITCRNVDSARLWKGKCLRTRLAEEVTLWSSGLFYAKAQNELLGMVLGLQQLALAGRVEARFFQASDACMSFDCDQCCGQQLDVLMGRSGVLPNILWLHGDDDGISDKIQVYVKQIADSFIENERSLFPKATLQTAQTLVKTEQCQESNKEEQAGSRSCYNLHSELLANIVELWIETRLLSDPTGLQLRYEAGNRPQQQADSASTWVTVANTGSVEHLSPPSPSYEIIKTQLLRALETRAANLSKQIINELERRLLQRQQASRFATFISAVVLLSCVERMTGFYWAMESEVDQGSGPLEQSPSKFWQQGEHFADLVNMLLRMRALPPKTMQQQDGMLTAVQDYSLPVHVNGRPVVEQINEQTKSAAAWLDPLQLYVPELIAKRVSQKPAKGAGIEAWDMKFVSKALLPENAKSA